ncbi:hypothetical protein HPP92_000982 [Vanilla planifolia]|uniref:VQ domain-containing protein n=1 Tax=Vanilla planifolia TaxID=51239 RepID=A0A835RXC1_VANPL|nr:hypothetical protein HPP92_000982 [Vanilla planifolia]
MPPSSSSSPPSKVSSSSSPTRLRVAKEPWKPRKPSPGDRRSPVIVHVEPPRVIHAEPQEFMTLVQLLTGKPAPATGVASVGTSPAPAVFIRSVPDINVAYVADDEEEESGFCNY